MSSEPTADGTNPFDVLRAWLPANTDPARPVMTLASVDRAGAPAARTVLLSEFDQDGVHFHTDATSRKVAELNADPRACAVIVLDEGARQIVLRGSVTPLDQDARLRAYRRRTRYLQVLAWLNTDEMAREPVAVRRARWREFEERNPGELDPPPTWMGYLLRPERISFWVADPAGPSTRLEFERSGSGWASQRLAG